MFHPLCNPLDTRADVFLREHFEGRVNYGVGRRPHPSLIWKICR